MRSIDSRLRKIYLGNFGVNPEILSLNHSKTDLATEKV